MDWHVLTKMSRDWRFGELVKTCRNDPGLVRHWQLIVQNWGSALIDEDWLDLACIGMDWPRLADWKIVVERGYRVWNDPILTLDWHWIGAGLTWDRCLVCNGLDPNWH